MQFVVDSFDSFAPVKIAKKMSVRWQCEKLSKSIIINHNYVPQVCL